MVKKVNGIGVLARLFKKTPSNSLVAELYSRAIGVPLFCHAQMGDQIIHAYLREPQSSARTEGEYHSVTTILGEIAVIDISGPLVNRPMTGPSGTGPLSYEDIRNEMDQALIDDSIKYIIMRFDTCGGEASQNIDLSDYIYSQRGKKPIIGMIDDKAYSAGYALASACDQIWVTRTSGVGSIGVVAYHEDKTEQNIKRGVKAEYIYYGDRKVDFNPNSPLSDEARNIMREEVYRLGDMFTQSVARNRNTTQDVIIAMEAACYHGPKAIEAGLADKLGTFNDLLAHLQNGEYTTSTTPVVKKEPKKEPEENPEPKQEKNSPPLQQLTETQKQEAEIKAICTAAGLADVASDYIQAATSVKQVRQDILMLAQTGDQEINASQSASQDPSSRPPATDNPLSASKIYAKFNQRGQ